MKYKVIKLQFMNEYFYHIIVDKENNEYISFPAEIGNPNYDEFLINSNLIHDNITILTRDTWIEV